MIVAECDLARMDSLSGNAPCHHGSSREQQYIRRSADLTGDVRQNLRVMFSQFLISDKQALGNTTTGIGVTRHGRIIFAHTVRCRLTPKPK